MKITKIPTIGTYLFISSKVLLPKLLYLPIECRRVNG